MATALDRRLEGVDFAEFYEAVHGRSPWQWQGRLAVEVVDVGGWPDVIDAPTGAGKTSVADIAIFALAARPEISPRRLVWVINRRIVVDEVYTHVAKINARLSRALERSDGGVVGAVAESLRAMTRAAPGDSPDLVGMSALRGGKVLADDWTRHPPDRPWVAVSTIDQFGSRLLHRGYGVSRRTRSMHAGLAANDCLVVLDEMHTSKPLYDTIKGALAADSRKRCNAERWSSLPDRFEVVQMSATPGPVGSSRTRFALTPEERDEPGLKPRLQTVTDVTLVKVPHKKVPQNPRDRAAVRAENTQKVARSAADIIASLDGNLAVRTVGVVANTVAAARAIHRHIQSAGYTSHLLTGRMRPLDKATAVERVTEVAAISRDGAARDPGTRPDVVVATQTIEVGADFDFDAMITECGPADSLRQRFGRLDRAGGYAERSGGGNPQAWILGGAKEDLVYAGAAMETWDHLNACPQTVTQKVGRKTVTTLTADLDFWAAAGPWPEAPKPDAPQVQAAHLEAWAETMRPPMSDPASGDFLHGIGAAVDTDVSICWREDHSAEALRLAPLRTAEFLAAPCWAARRWIAGRLEEEAGPSVADVDAATPAGADVNGAAAPEGGCVIWEGFGKKPLPVKRVRDIKPGDVVVVKPSAGGIRDGTWDPAAGGGEHPPEDLGNRAQCDYGRAVLTLDERRMRRYMPEGGCPKAPAPPGGEEDDGANRKTEIESALSDVAQNATEPWAREAATHLLAAGGRRSDDYLEDAGCWVAACRIEASETEASDTTAFDGSDESDSFTGSAVALNVHLEEVAQTAAVFADSLGFPPPIRASMVWAARLHDIGKADPRWQEAITGGDTAELAADGVLLAKSPPDARPGQRRFPPVRHESLSVAMAESDSHIREKAERDGADWDLVLYLIGSHHGYGRPLPGTLTDPEHRLVRYRMDGYDMACNTADLGGGRFAFECVDRFNALAGRYGYYGLAWMEAVLRMADWQASAGNPVNPEERQTT